MIRVEQRDSVTIVTIDRPDRRNAVDHAALDGLEQAVAGAVDASSRALVLTGAGGHFCAGADLSTVEDTEFVQALNRTLVALSETSFPTIAAVEGAALGAGTQLAVACDLRVATADARFGIPAARLGLMVDHWTIHRLMRVAGEGPARAMLLAAEVYRGDQAERFGLVQRVGGLDAALEWADEIAGLAPLTIAGHKVGLADVAPAAGGSDHYRSAFRAAWSSDDLQEGMAAFRERRPARFTGT
jgi:enoyl-CoA hydratase